MTPIRPESSAGLRMRSMIVLTRTRAMSRLRQRRAEWAVSQLQWLSTLHGGILQRDKAVWRVSLVGGSMVWVTVKRLYLPWHLVPISTYNLAGYLTATLYFYIMITYIS